MPGREPEEQVLHDHLVKLLHREYYRYPNDEHPNLLTFVNHPVKTKAVRNLERRDLFPDIVVLNTANDRIAVLAEVETESTVDALEAAEWLEFSKVGARLHLYFPRGFGPQVAELCRDCSDTELVQYWKSGSRYVIERFGELGPASQEEDKTRGTAG
jgi:hypothetical protein